MASSTQIKTGLTTLIQSHVSDKLQNTLFNRMPLLYFLMGKDGDKTGPIGLGRPKVNGQSKGIFVTGMETAKPRREEILGSRIYEPIVQTTGPAMGDGKVLGMYDTMPTRTAWDTLAPSSYFTRPRVKWVERADPYSVPNKEIRTTKSVVAGKELPAWRAIGSLFQAETTSVLATHNKWWNQELYGTNSNTGPSNEDATVWDNVHPMSVALDGTSTYCGVDRTVAANAYWKGAGGSGKITSAFGADFENLINYCNYDLGMASKGTGIDLLLMGGALFKKAKSEAKAKSHQLIYSSSSTPAIPDFGFFGFQREVVKIDNTWICYDPELDTANFTAHVLALNLSTWTLAIHPDSNFKVSEPFDQSKIKGGEDSQTGQIRTELMLVCEVPSLNAYFSNVS